MGGTIGAGAFIGSGYTVLSPSINIDQILGGLIGKKMNRKKIFYWIGVVLFFTTLFLFFKSWSLSLSYYKTGSSVQTDTYSEIFKQRGGVVYVTKDNKDRLNTFFTLSILTFLSAMGFLLKGGMPFGRKVLEFDDLNDLKKKS